jgi:phospholipid transport system transporter-binding protein
MSELLLKGQLLFSTISEKKPPFLRAIETSQERNIVVSMKEVTKADSAGLALMIEGVRFSKKHGKSLVYCDVPKHLNSLATFCQLGFIMKGENVTFDIEKTVTC